MPGQTDWRVQITHYLSHRDYTIVQRECYHSHAKRRLPCVTAACEQDPRKYLKNTVCSQGLSTSCPFRLKSKGDPVSLIYLDVTPVPVSCIWVCFPLLWPKIGTNHTRASVQTTLKRESNKMHAKHNHNVWFIEQGASVARVRPPSSSPGLNRHINISNPQNQRIENVGNHYCMLGI